MIYTALHLYIKAIMSNWWDCEHCPAKADCADGQAGSILNVSSLFGHSLESN